MSARVVMAMVLVAGPLSVWSRALSGARLGEGPASALAVVVAVAAVVVAFLASAAPAPASPRVGRPASRRGTGWPAPRRRTGRPALRFVGVMA